MYNVFFTETYLKFVVVRECSNNNNDIYEHYQVHNLTSKVKQLC